ncbi:MAG: PD40 domain-containing protein [Acidobacteria bacterium]|nr:PD40 domain-containing protein [Acidobacteriota bacterium]
MTPAKEPLSPAYEFGPFHMALAEHRLYRQGEMVLLPPKEFELLLLLVQHAGQVMERDRLIKALWPNTIVEEANLNVHISALRKVLATNSGDNQYIETLPRLGYRFIAPVAAINPIENPTTTTSALPLLNREEPSFPVAETQETVSTVEPKAAWYSHLRLTAVTLPLWLLAVAVIGILAVLYFKPFQPTSRENAGDMAANVTPLTTYPGRESQPAFSADGNHLAFVWRGEKDDNADIYVRLVDGGNSVQVTNQTGDDVNPSWSPDGRTIAFYRSTNEGDGIYLVPALGGAERKLTDTWATRSGFGSHTWLHWSPQGNWIVVSDKPSAQEPFSLFLLAPDTGERKRLTTAPASVVGDCSPVFSPDGKQIAFVRLVSSVLGEIYLVAAEGSEPKRLTFSGEGISSLTWTPNGKEIVFSSRYGGKNRLLRVSVEGGTPQWVAASGNDAIYPAFSGPGNRLAWTRNTDNTDVFRLALKEDGDSNHQLTSIIASTASEISPRYSPDGRRIVFESNRSGTNEIWVCDKDGGNPVRITSFRGPLAGSPSWSPDGKQIVFDCRPDSNADIYVVSSEGGTPRRLTNDLAEDIVPSWSRDGRSIYFSSKRSGSLQIWKMDVNGTNAVQITKNGGFDPIESPDGQWLYFTQDRGSSQIWRMPVAGGEETPIFDFHQKNYSRMWLVVSDGIYFAVPASSTRTGIKFFDFATNSEKSLAEVDVTLRSSVSGLSLSPDGKWLIFPVTTQRGSDLMMIEDFR